MQLQKKTLSIQREMLEDGKNHRRVPKKDADRGHGRVVSVQEYQLERILQ